MSQVQHRHLPPFLPHSSSQCPHTLTILTLYPAVQVRHLSPVDPFPCRQPLDVLVFIPSSASILFIICPMQMCVRLHSLLYKFCPHRLLAFPSILKIFCQAHSLDNNPAESRSSSRVQNALGAQSAAMSCQPIKKTKHTKCSCITALFN